MTPKRNDQCTCGSGKKFKKCCKDKPFYGPIQHFEISRPYKGVSAWIPLTAWAFANRGDCFK